MADGETGNETTGEGGTERPSRAVIVMALLGLSVGGIIVALLVVEIIFRLVYRPPLSWNDRPQSYFIPENATVLTDKSYPEKKKPGTIRIAVVGDSFSFAPYMQFDDTFAKRLERWLNLNDHQPPVEVINYGVPRYSTSHEVAVVERAIKAEADLILLQITLNDPEIKPYRPTGLLVDENTGEVKVTNRLFSHWRSLGYVVTRIRNTETHKEYVRYFFKLFEGKKTWRNFHDSLKAIVSRCKDAQVPLVATVFPLFGHPVNADYPFYPLHEKVAGALHGLNVPSLDIAQSYRDIPLERLQVIPIVDRHPNEIGHRIAAEAIMPWLQGLNLLPQAIFPRRVVPERIGIIPPDAVPKGQGVDP